jgi:hypothetical protein
MNVRISQVFSFIAGAWWDDALEMAQYTVKLWMITQTPNELEQNIAFRRVKHFVHYELDSTIFIDQAEQQKCAELAGAGLNVTTLPGIPADQMIGIMLFHKLNAITEGRIGIVEVEISANDTVIYLHGENETSTDVNPPAWWGAADSTHADAMDVNENIVSLKSAVTWRDLDLAWPEEDPPVDSGNTIVFADFKSSNDTK